jgi:hypothetical protein
MGHGLNFQGDYNEQDVLREIVRLYREDEFDDYIHVHLEGLTLTAGMADDLATLFRDANKRGAEWGSLIFVDLDDDDDDEHFHSLLLAACEADIFAKFLLNNQSDHTEPMALKTAGILKDHIINGSLDEFSLEFITISEGVCEILCEALKKNRGLEGLSLVNCRVSDKCLARIIGSLADLNSLDRLCLEQTMLDDVKYPETVEALAALLSTPNCKITRLDLTENAFADVAKPLLNLDPFWKRLKRNCCLQKLDLSMNDLDDQEVSKIFINLSSLPSLGKINLYGNNVTNLKIISSSLVPQKEPSRLRKLNLDNNNFGSDGKEALLAIARYFPELSSFGPLDLCPDINHVLDLNLCGRVLLTGYYKPIPLSVWPLVLARTNRKLRNKPVSCASVIFDLFQGLFSLPLAGRMPEEGHFNDDQCKASTPSKKRRRLLRG